MWYVLAETWLWKGFDAETITAGLLFWPFSVETLLSFAIKELFYFS